MSKTFKLSSLLFIFLCAVPIISQAQGGNQTQNYFNYEYAGTTLKYTPLGYNVEYNGETLEACSVGQSDETIVGTLEIPEIALKMDSVLKIDSTRVKYDYQNREWIYNYDTTLVRMDTTRYVVTEIADNGFSYGLGTLFGNDDTKMSGVIMPNTLTKIGEGAFSGRDGLTEITIPASVDTIGTSAFGSCKNLQYVTCLGENPSYMEKSHTGWFGEYINFMPTNRANIVFNVPNKDYLTAPGWSYFTSQGTTYIPGENTLITSRWNFVAGLDNQASLYNSNNPASFVNGFTADASLNNITDAQNPHCDIAIVGYDYNNNNWGNESAFLYADSTMKKGAGYFVWPFNENAKGTTITSDGTITTVSTATNYTTSGSSITWNQTNSGSANTSGTGTDAVSAKWFAFGNPFDKNLSKTDILNALSNVQSDVLYTYNAYNSKWNTATTVLPGEGFMVAAEDGQNTVSGTISYPTTNSAPMQPESYGIRFTLTSNGISCDMFAKQENNAQDGFDTKDAYALFGNNENLVEPYFVVEGRQIIHNRYNSDNYACDVNFHAQKSGVAELSVSDVPEGTTVSIVDLTMNTETVLENEPYQIDVEAGENANRYQIKINKGSVSLPQTIEKEANITIWNNNKEIFVKGENLQRVEVYNTLGQMVYQREVSGESYNFTFDNEGAYIIKAAAAGCSNGQSHDNGTKTQKIVIR